MWERWPRGASERVPCVARGEVVDEATELEELTNWLLQSSKAGSEIRPAVTSHISNTPQRSPSGPDREKLPLPGLTDTSPEHIQNEGTHITGWLRKTLLCNRHNTWVKTDVKQSSWKRRWREEWMPVPSHSKFKLTSQWEMALLNLMGTKANEEFPLKFGDFNYRGEGVKLLCRGEVRC